MSFVKYVLLAFSFMSIPGFASEWNLDNTVFSGKFRLDRMKSTETCKLNDMGDLEFVPADQPHAIKYVHRNHSFQIMTNINQGKIRFNSCFSDGILGYSETVLKKNKLEKKTTYLKPGFFCRGGGVDYIRTYTWEMRGNEFIELINRKVYCVYTRIQD